MWQSGTKPSAAAVDTPQHLVDALSPRKTQIIPLELMAAAGMLYTYQDKLRGQDVIFFIDNQSVCCALVKGCSRSWDIQLLATSWQLLCLQLGCRCGSNGSPLNPTQRISFHANAKRCMQRKRLSGSSTPPPMGGRCIQPRHEKSL